MVTICNHLVALSFGKRKYEIRWKSSLIAFDLLVQALGRDTIERSEIGVYDRLVTTDYLDAMSDRRAGNECRGFVLLGDDNLQKAGYSSRNA